MKINIVTATIATMCAVIFVVSSPSVASADPLEPTIDEIVYAPMDIVGYDREVAAANGFEIVIVDGEETSVPVSPEAHALVAAAAPSPGTVTPFGYAVIFGDCGSSWVRLYTSTNGILNISTGYAIGLPTVTRQWGVLGAGTGGGFNVSFNGGYYAGHTWTGTATVSYWGSGAGHVALGSFAQRLDGAMCYSGNPGTTF